MSTSRVIISFILLILLSLAVISSALLLKKHDTSSDSQKIETAQASLSDSRLTFTGGSDLQSYLLYISRIDTLVELLKYERSAVEDSFYRVLSHEASEQYGQPWRLYYALWKVESSFDSSARSPKDAIGLGQVMLGTARQHVDSSYTETDLYDPIKNSLASAKILHDYIKLFDNNLIYGLAAYNAGPKNIQPSFKSRSRPFNWSYVTSVLEKSVYAE